MRPVERTNRLKGGLQQNLAALLREISLGFRREMHIAHLAQAENELLASPLEDELRFVFREHVRGAVVFLSQLLLPLHHLPGEANDHVVLIGLSVDRDGSECGAFDLHGRYPCSYLRTRLLTLYPLLSRLTRPVSPLVPIIRSDPRLFSRHRRRAVGPPPQQRSWAVWEA